MKAIAAFCLAAVVLLASAIPLMAEVGWCGNVFPNDGNLFTSDEDINCYIQVWKEGVTDQPGQGADIAAALFYRCVGEPSYTELAMSYLGDVGNNDEYTAVIPSGHGCDTVDYYCVITDLSDTTECAGQDQNTNDPPFLLPITQVTSQAVTVNFHMCLTSAVETEGDICVTGNKDELTNWGDGVPMVQECPADSPKTYIASITFAAGSNPAVEYKYKKDACQTWESVGNRSFLIDDSGPMMDLMIDTWENGENDCPECQTPVENSTWGAVKALYD
jgi:hypothetical protein